MTAFPDSFNCPIRYRLLKVIAEGGMSTIYKAVQFGPDNFSKTVAVKIILDKYSTIPEFRHNFIGEARLVADLIHTNIVQIYHLDQLDYRYFMIMEYVDGINLEDFLVRHLSIEQPIPVELAVFIVSRICRGLNYAHKKTDSTNVPLGIVHRDVNPRNVLISFEGNVKLTDFGIAKAFNLMYNREGLVIAGKDEYLSPEQARKEVTDARADLFPCGIILSELLLGKNIFQGATAEKTRENILKLPIPDFRKLSPLIDDKLNAILKKSLERPRNKRFQSAEDMQIALETYLYSDHYGPTNEKLAAYLTPLFKYNDKTAFKLWQKNKKVAFTRPPHLL